MTMGEKLLNLTIEYQQSVENRSGWGVDKPDGREPSVIAADYEATITELLKRAA